DHQRQRRVLRAGDRNGAGQAIAAADTDAIQFRLLRRNGNREGGRSLAPDFGRDDGRSCATHFSPGWADGSPAARTRACCLRRFRLARSAAARRSSRAFFAGLLPAAAPGFAVSFVDIENPYAAGGPFASNLRALSPCGN